MSLAWRKIAFAVLVLVSITFASGTPLDDFVKKMGDFVKQDGRCVIALADIPTGKYAQSSYWFPKEVICVGEVSWGVGMDKRDGCAVFSFNVHNMLTTVIHSGRQEPAFVDHANCNDAFEKLMAIRTAYGTTMGTMILTNPLDWMRPEIVYYEDSARGKKFKEWFETQRSKMPQQIAQEKQQEKQWKADKPQDKKTKAAANQGLGGQQTIEGTLR